MGNNLENSANVIEEWNIIEENIEPDEIVGDIEEIIEPFQRDEVISNLVSGLRTVKFMQILEAASIGSLAAMQLFRSPSQEEIIDSDSEDLEISRNKLSEMP